MHRAWVSRPKTSLIPTTHPSLTRSYHLSRYPLRSSYVLTAELLGEQHGSNISLNTAGVRHFSAATQYNAGGKRTVQRPKAGTGQKSQRNVLSAQGSRVRTPISRTSGSRAQRIASPETPASRLLQDLAKTLKLPTAAELKGLPRNLLTQPTSALVAYVERLNGYQEKSSRKGADFIHTISINDTSVGGKIESVGRANSDSLARNAAYLQFLSDVYVKGLVQAMFPLSAAVASREKHAMLDIYLFAARYQDLPQITTRSGEKRRRGTAYREIEVSLPLMGITVIGRGNSERTAEIAAALNARNAIERYISTSAASEQKVSDDEVFGFASASAFWQWHRYQSRGNQVNLETTAASSRSRDSLKNTKITIIEGDSGQEMMFEASLDGTKKAVEDLAHLIAAVSYTRQHPDLRSKFFEEYRRNNNQVLPPVMPLDFYMTRDTATAMQRAIADSRHAADRLQVEEDYEDDAQSERIRSTMYKGLPESSYQKKNAELKSRKDAYESRDDLRGLRKTRSEYPMNQYTQQVLQTVKDNVYSIIIGATGSGKTTQVPQILLNEAVERGDGAGCNIICTQPRRIAAKSVAQRVADERAEYLGDCVGYHVKKDAKLPSYGGCINFCTTGILTQQLQHHADEILDNVSHIIVDEVHERDTIIDFLLTSLKRLVKERTAAGKNVPHIILMSATIDPDLFANYLTIEGPNGERVECSTLSVPGRTFPVRELYLEDVVRRVKGTSARAFEDQDTNKFIAAEQEFVTNSGKEYADNNADEGGNVSINWEAERKRATAKGRVSVEEQEQALVPHALAASTIAHIAETTNEGAILTFLPGIEDITKINDLLRTQSNPKIDFNDESKFKIFMLHSSIQAPQKEVFDPVPAGCRKIILSTNIAETSITIPDVQHVVDTGKMRELQYDQTRRITKLACVWVSKSNAKQRAGRAGRVQDGNYYALYSKERYNSLRAVGLPELLRSDLQEVCLNIKNQGYTVPIKEFLSETIEPPSMTSVDQAIENLISLKALRRDETLTALGQLLAQLPVHPSLGKMIVLGIVFRCLDPMLIIGSSFSERNIFVQPLNAKNEAREKKDGFARTTLSDHIGLLAAVKELRMLQEVRGPRAMGDYAMRNFLHMGAFRSILSTADTIEQLLVDHGVISKTSRLDRAHFQIGDPQLNENSDKVGLIKALVLAGFYPNLAVRRGRVNYRTPQETNTMIHPSSINGVTMKALKNKNEILNLNDPKTELLTFSEMVRSADGQTMYLRETTPVTPLMSVLFSSKLEARGRNTVKMDDWLPFYMNEASNINPLLRLHSMMERVTTAAFKDLAAKRVLTDHEERNQFADSLVELLDSDLSYNATRTPGRSPDSRRASLSDGRRADPSRAFVPGRRGPNDSQRTFSGVKSQEPWKQELWDNLVSSWAEKGKGKTSSGGESQSPLSTASLFAEGHADLKSSGHRAARSRGY